jgi:hypothetical protein
MAVLSGSSMRMGLASVTEIVEGCVCAYNLAFAWNQALVYPTECAHDSGVSGEQ